MAAGTHNVQARVSRAEIYLASRDWGRAAADYRDALQLDEKLGKAYQAPPGLWQRARTSGIGTRSGAYRTQKALELDGDKDPRYIETLAAAYANAGQYDSAVAILQGHLDKMPQQYVSRTVADPAL